ncbi:MAG: T9SS type A sorting domain-containing protein [Melioribacteraceae bacterium]|nr:T9SS type A sorting domain-containing protein [Melioribacteraceae bacterium]
MQRKKLLSHSVISLTILLIVFIYPFFYTNPAQNFQTNKKVNHILEGEQNNDGSNSIAINGSNIFVLWQNMGGGYFSYVSKSTDGGVTFSDGVKVGGDQPQLFGSITCDTAGVVYVAWSGIAAGGEMPDGIFFAKSIDGGATFSSPVTVSPHGLFATIKVHNSHVYVSYYAMKENSTLEVYFARSTNGGTSFENPYPINTVPVIKTKFDSPHSMYLDDAGVIYCIWNDGRRGGDGTDIYWAKSVDNGLSFSPNIMVNDINGSRDKLRTAPSIAVAGSNVYVIWREETDDTGANRRILFSKSTNGGTTFGAEKEIAVGGWGSPKLVMNKKGDIYLGYPQFTEQKNGIFCAKSIDQGNTFPESVFINDVNSDSKNLSIAIDQNDVLYAVWSDNRNDNKDVYFSKGTIVVTDIQEDENNIPTEFALYQNYPNPFNPITTIKYSIPAGVETSNMTSLRVFDILGKEVAVLVNQKQSAGNYEVKLDASHTEQGRSMASGVYFYKLQVGNYISVKKLVLMK